MARTTLIDRSASPKQLTPKAKPVPAATRELFSSIGPRPVRAAQQFENRVLPALGCPTNCRQGRSMDFLAKGHTTILLFWKSGGWSWDRDPARTGDSHLCGREENPLRPLGRCRGPDSATWQPMSSSPKGRLSASPRVSELWTGGPRRPRRRTASCRTASCRRGTSVTGRQQHFCVPPQ